MSNVKVIIAAAGKSKRFGGLNKAILPINGIPIIQNSVIQAAQNGYTEIGIIVNIDTYTEIISLLGNGSRFGCNIIYFFQEQTDEYGFPVAICQTKKWIQDKDDVIILCGDNYIVNINLKQLHEVYTQEKHTDKILVACKNIPIEEGINYAVLEKGVIDKFHEKPSIEKINDFKQDTGGVIAYAGPLIANKNMFKHINNLKTSERGEKEIVDVINSHKKIIAHKHDGLWFDIGSEVNYINAISEVKK
jgi:glucose-1-phosphate thymidylyltransferase